MKKGDRLDAKTQSTKSRRKAPDPPDALDSQTVSNNPKKARVPEETAAWREPSSAEAATAHGGDPDGQDVPAEVPADLARHSRYRIIRLLGMGGMGAVFQAEHRLMDRLVALKVIAPRFMANAAAVERFQREVRAAARLGEHPNIVTAYDAEAAGQTHFLVMEYVEGQTLAARLKKRGPLPVAEACDIIRQAALGLQHAHEKGMVHRDIKPDNLMRTRDGQIKILDFGLVRLGRPSQEVTTTASAAAVEDGAEQLTQAGVAMGTPDYIAPEQAKDFRQADIRADVYSLGCTFYQLLTGQVPHPEDSAVEKMTGRVRTPPTPLRDLRPDVSARLAAVVDKMMARKRSQRLPDACGGRRGAGSVAGRSVSMALVVAGGGRRVPGSAGGTEFAAVPQTSLRARCSWKARCLTSKSWPRAPISPFRPGSFVPA